LKVTENPQVISFAGGLPNAAYFPAKEIAQACLKVLNYDNTALQYSTTEGYLPLRQYIAQRYAKRHGLKIDPDTITITNGSQQGLDLIGKVFIDKGDKVIIERPGYLGAIQAFGVYEPEFQPISLLDDGIDTAELARALKKNRIKLFHMVANFQNPSGITYSKEKRLAVADMFMGYNGILVEDDPYGELRFTGENLPSLRHYLEDNLILLGSFSKIVSPGLRLGWICASPDITEKIIIVKQASDLHSNYLAQRILYQYLSDNDIDEHIFRIKQAYSKQKDCMIATMEQYFPAEVEFTRPQGGMFLWISLPKGLSSAKLFELAIQENIAFVPGKPFYVDGGGDNTLRLNFSNSDENRIEEGIKRLANIIKRFLTTKS
jgi:2-aminoadipate transaminase